jgi:hypothetical protein
MGLSELMSESLYKFYEKVKQQFWQLLNGHSGSIYTTETGNLEMLQVRAAFFPQKVALSAHN